MRLPIAVHLSQLSNPEYQSLFFIITPTIFAKSTTVLGMDIESKAAHILTAMALGARFGELKLGVHGNKSVGNPSEWFAGKHQAVVHSVSRLAVGTIFPIYRGYWMQNYLRNHSFLTWSLGAIALMLTAMQLATGYLEGRYRMAYIIGAMVFLLPTDVLTYRWTIPAVFLHWSLCPWHQMKANY